MPVQTSRLPASSLPTARDEVPTSTVAADAAEGHNAAAAAAGRTAAAAAAAAASAAC